MTLPVHVVGGFFLTGVACALAGVHMLEPVGIAVTVVGSVLPDIDHVKSPVGRIVPPLSRWLNRRHGHRNLTHSAVFTAALCLIFGLVESAVYGETRVTTIFTLAYSSHILLDMFTLHGVGLFYPFVRNMAVLPGNSKYRVKTGNPRTEAGIFVGFCVVTIGAMPLIEQGFWTSYNRTFSTPQHLVSEFEKSRDLLEATYTVRRGSAEESGRGFVVHPGPERVVLIQGGQFRVLDQKKEKIVTITPAHTGREIWFENVAFEELPADSLAKLTEGMMVIQGQLTGNRAFVAMGEKRNTWKVSNLVGLYVRDDHVAGEFVPPEYVEPPRVQSILKRLSRIEMTSLRSRQEYADAVRRRELLTAAILREADMVRRQQLQSELAAISVPAPSSSDELAAQLRADARVILDDSRIAHEEAVRAAQVEWKEKQPEPLLLSGYLEFVRFGAVTPMKSI